MSGESWTEPLEVGDPLLVPVCGAYTLLPPPINGLKARIVVPKNYAELGLKNAAGGMVKLSSEPLFAEASGRKGFCLLPF